MKEVNRVDLGSIKIHKKVLADIAISAVEAIDGVWLVRSAWAGQLKGVLGAAGQATGVFVTVDANNEVSIELRIRVRYGLNIPDVARQVQNAVRSAIEKTADIDLKDINVNIQGVEKDEGPGGPLSHMGLEDPPTQI